MICRMWALQWSRGLSTAEGEEDRICSLLARHSLQWSRGLSTAEGARRPGLWEELPRASMEPRSFDRGGAERAAVDAAGRHASMEPRSFDRGGPQPGPQPDRGGVASMEPRSFDRGGGGPSAYLPVAHRLQWSRGLSTAEGSLQVPAVTRAFVLPLQWSRGLSTAEGKDPHQVRAGRGPASMEPRSFDRGGVLSSNLR